MKVVATRRSRYLSIGIIPNDGMQRSFSYPYRRVEVRSNLVMKINTVYQVKEIIFKLTKREDGGYLTTLPYRLCHNQYNDNQPYGFQYLIGCYLALEKRS